MFGLITNLASRVANLLHGIANRIDFSDRFSDTTPQDSNESLYEYEATPPDTLLGMYFDKKSRETLQITQEYIQALELLQASRLVFSQTCSTLLDRLTTLEISTEE